MVSWQWLLECISSSLLFKTLSLFKLYIWRVPCFSRATAFWLCVVYGWLTVSWHLTLLGQLVVVWVTTRILWAYYRTRLSDQTFKKKKKDLPFLHADGRIFLPYSWCSFLRFLCQVVQADQEFGSLFLVAEVGKYRLKKVVHGHSIRQVVSSVEELKICIINEP